MKNEMRLQGIGLVEGTEAGKIQIGDILRWNFGGLSKVVAIEFTKTGKTIICEVEWMNSKGEIETAERKMRTNRLVNIVASGNTVLTSQYAFEIIEEAAEEIEAAPALTIPTSVTTKKAAAPASYDVFYRVTNYGCYVDIMLFVEDITNNMMLVAQKEAQFETMKDAETFIGLLEEAGSKIEYVETVAYTG
jgi:hypothetical protein